MAAVRFLFELSKIATGSVFKFLLGIKNRNYLGFQILGFLATFKYIFSETKHVDGAFWLRKQSMKQCTILAETYIFFGSKDRIYKIKISLSKIYSFFLTVKCEIKKYRKELSGNILHWLVSKEVSKTILTDLKEEYFWKKDRIS